MRSDLTKLDSFTLDMSKNHLLRNFLRNGCLRVKILNFILIITCSIILVPFFSFFCEDSGTHSISFFTCSTAEVSDCLGLSFDSWKGRDGLTGKS